MTNPPADGSRDRRIEDPTNLWLIHPAARALLPWALRYGVTANMVSYAGLVSGFAAAFCFAHWANPLAVIAGLAFAIGWLIFDGLDGMVARATGSASRFGRFLDGCVDHGVFLAMYVALAITVGTVGGWVLAIIAGVAHAVQSSLYEGERARFHRRAKGVALVAVPRPAGPFLMRLYDSVATYQSSASRRFEQRLDASADPLVFGRSYADAAAPGMHWMALLSANCRVWLIALACLAENPRIFWWVEIVALSLVAALTMRYQRRIEDRFAGMTTASRRTASAALSPGKQGQ